MKTVEVANLAEDRSSNVWFYCQLDQANNLLHKLKECPNINAVWASLVIEECSRLGLTVSDVINYCKSVVATKKQCNDLAFCSSIFV